MTGRNQTDEGPEYLVASESVALTAFGFELMRDVMPGKAVFIDESGKFNSRQCAAKRDGRLTVNFGSTEV